MSTLSVVINTKNASATLKRALKSVAFADEIVIADMQSSDDTLKIAEEFTKKIISVPDIEYVEPARNKAVSTATCDWIFILDADEEMSPGLKEWIQKLLAGDVADAADCYEIPRQNIIFVQSMKATGWWPDYQMRLFKKGTVTWQNKIHSQPIVEGKVAKLPADEKVAIIHHNYQTVSQFLQRLDRYTQITAEDQGPLTTEHELQFLSHFFGEFLGRFFAHRGFNDGHHGQALSLLQSMYELVVTLKRWELSNFVTHPSLTQKQLLQIRRDLNYWIADYMYQESSGISKVIWGVRRKFKI